LVVEMVLIGGHPHVDQVPLEEMAASEEQRKLVPPVLNTIGDIIRWRESVFI